MAFTDIQTGEFYHIIIHLHFHTLPTDYSMCTCTVVAILYSTVVAILYSTVVAILYSTVVAILYSTVVAILYSSLLYSV